MKLILKGFIIGIGKIIPGVSGSIIAINLGVYEKSLNCITTFFNNIKYNIKYLGLLGIGIVLSISIFSKWIVFLLDNYYLVTMSVFLGLIIGGSNIENYGHKYNYISLLSFSLILCICLLSGVNTITLSNSIYKFFYLIFVGIVEAITMIVPGISGTAVLMMLGAYDLITRTYSNIFNTSLIIHNLFVLVPLFMGIVMGIYIVSKIIDYCFKVYKVQTYQAIKGCVYGTIFSIAFSLLKNITSIHELFYIIIVNLITIIFTQKIKLSY